MITYYKLWDVMNRKGITKKQLQESIKCGSKTIQSMRDNDYVNLSTIDKICDYLDCQPGDIIEFERLKSD